jgi:hypothetical protein
MGGKVLSQIVLEFGVTRCALAITPILSRSHARRW